MSIIVSVPSKGRQVSVELPEDDEATMRDFKGYIEAAYHAAFGERLHASLLLHPGFLPAMEVALPLSEPARALLRNLSSISVKVAAPSAGTSAGLSRHSPAHSRASLGGQHVPAALPVGATPVAALAPMGGSVCGGPPVDLCGLSYEERHWMREVNALSDATSSSGFGDFGRPGRAKLWRQARFLRAASERWPQLGTLLIRDGQVVPDCAFWQRGRAEYFRILARYVHALNGAIRAEDRQQLLWDLGFHVADRFLTAGEEELLMDYWGPESEAYSLGETEQCSRRRFFPYGPILTRTVPGSTKSAVAVIPARLGAFPELVEVLRLSERLAELGRRCFARSREPFDQLYVNHYLAACGAYIDFHHDHHTSMAGHVAGLNLGTDCNFCLRVSDSHALRPWPVRVPMPRRAAYVMTGLSRWHLQHAVLDLPADRLSLTFRTVDCASVGEAWLWERSWVELSQLERANAKLPLLPPPAD